MLQLRLKHVGEINFRQLKSRLNWIERDQLPFAVAKTLTKTAYQASDEIKNNLRMDFILRNRYTERGIRVRRATKHRPQSEVGSIDEYMVLQELGGTKTARDGRVAVPRDIKKDVKELIKKRNRPGPLMKRANEKAGTRKRKGGKPLPFFARMSSGKEGIFVRRGKGRVPIDVLYVFEDSVEITPRLGLRKTAARVADENMQENFNAAFTEALATARG